MTGRELEVLRLVAQGLGNAEIAGRLQLSRRTVDAHVSNLLLKTGQKSRKGLAVPGMTNNRTSTATVHGRLDVGDVELEYWERGPRDATALLLVHAGVFGEWFRPMFDEPALDGFRVVRVHRAGYGASSRPRAHLTLADHARQCCRLLRGLGVRRAHWTGHSSSGCIGLQAALDHPDLIAGLVLLEPAPNPAGPSSHVLAREVIGPAMAAVGAGDIAQAADTFLRGVDGPTTGTSSRPAWARARSTASSVTPPSSSPTRSGPRSSGTSIPNAPCPAARATTGVRSHGGVHRRHTHDVDASPPGARSTSSATTTPWTPARPSTTSSGSGTAPSPTATAAPTPGPTSAATAIAPPWPATGSTTRSASSPAANLDIVLRAGVILVTPS